MADEKKGRCPYCKPDVEGSTFVCDAHIDVHIAEQTKAGVKERQDWLRLKTFTIRCHTRVGERPELRLEDVELGDVLRQAETLLERPSGITRIEIESNNRRGALLRKG